MFNNICNKQEEKNIAFSFGGIEPTTYKPYTRYIMLVFVWCSNN